MKLGIMQPYFIPYLGYFQLMDAVDKYVVYDDVNYINRGYINRNSILINGEAKRIVLPLKEASQNKLINEIELFNPEEEMKKLYRMFQFAYAKAPYCKQVLELLGEILFVKEKNLALFLFHSLKLISKYMDMKTELILSSSLEKDCSLKAEHKIYHICKIMKATQYYNPAGGTALYNKSEFEKRGMELLFLEKNKDITYKQYGNAFVDNLSIIDVMMFNSKEECQMLLQRFKLL